MCITEPPPWPPGPLDTQLAHIIFETQQSAASRVIIPLFAANKCPDNGPSNCYAATKLFASVILKPKQCWDLGPLPVLGAEDSRGLQSGCKVLAVLTLHFNISNKPLRLLLECKTKHHTFNTKTQALLVDLLKLTNITIYMLWND